MNSPKWLKYFFSVSALVLLIVQVHLAGSVGLTTIAILVIAILPWFELESLTIMGFYKMVFKTDLKRSERKAKEAGIEPKSPKSLKIKLEDSVKATDEVNTSVHSNDPFADFMSIRGKIDDTLYKICKKLGTKFKPNEKPNAMEMVHTLVVKDVISNYQSVSMAMSLALLNKAVHSPVPLDEESINRTMTLGNNLYSWLNEKLEELS